jgi:RHS repeat-associated protein
MRENNGIDPNVLSLPSGGGGISPLGERFQPDLVRGSGSYSVPIHLPKGPNGICPSLALTYSTGAGNGPFGFGWRLNIMRVERRTDKGIPEYSDKDTFVIGDAEVLVDVGGDRYRPKSDTKFWYIEKLANGWKIRTGDGKTLFLGCSPESRESHNGKDFAWYLEEEQDAAGNKINYSYIRDGERLYLDRINYGIFSVVTKYEDRPDIIRNGRSGFLRTMKLRAKALELHSSRLSKSLMRTYSITYDNAANGVSMLSKIKLWAAEGNEVSSFPELSFEYSTIDFGNWDIHQIKSHITPPSIEDETTQLVDMNGDALPDVIQISKGRVLLWQNTGDGWLEGPVELESVPSLVSLDNGSVAFADLDSNGRAELFSAQNGLQLMFESTGKGNFNSVPIVFTELPSIPLESKTSRLMDIDGDGVTDLISTEANNFLMYRHKPGKGWEEPYAVMRNSNLDEFPDVSFSSPMVRLSDMTGDGLSDMVSIESGNICFWPYLGNGNWASRVKMANSPVFPAGYRVEDVLLYDIDGDGCSDIVLIDSDKTVIWLNQSGTSFGDPIELPVVPYGKKTIPADFFGDGRPGLLFGGSASGESGTGYRYLQFDQSKKPYLMQKINNGMGGVHEIEYTNSTKMRMQDQTEGNMWDTQLPFSVSLVKSINEIDEISGRRTKIAIKYHKGVYDGREREFRGFGTVEVDLPGDESIPDVRQVLEFFQGNTDLDEPLERDRQRALAGALLSTKLFEVKKGELKLVQESNQTWNTRLEYANGQISVIFPYISQIETIEYGKKDSAKKVDRIKHMDHDSFGNIKRRIKESFALTSVEEQVIKTEELYSYTCNETEWIVKLPVKLECYDANGVPFSIKINYYDGEEFVGLDEGLAEKGLLTRSIELKLLKSRLPAGYQSGKDFKKLGYIEFGTGDKEGFYAQTFAVKRDIRGNIVSQKDALGAMVSISFDRDYVYPVKVIDALGKETLYTFNIKSGEPELVTLPDKRTLRFEYDAIGRLACQYETSDNGSERLAKLYLTQISSLPSSVTSVCFNGESGTKDRFSPATDFTKESGISVSRMYYDGFGKEILQITSAPEGPDGLKRFVESGRVTYNVRGTAYKKYPNRFVGGLDYTPSPAGLEANSIQRFDARGSNIETTGPGNSHFLVVRDAFTITHYEGDNAGAFGQDAPTGSPSRVEHFDARGRLIGIEEFEGSGEVISTRYRLNFDGRIEAVINSSKAELINYVLAGPDEPVAITHRDIGTRTYYRNAAGRIVECINPDGSSLNYSYDEAGRPTVITRVSSDKTQTEIVRQLFYDQDPEIPSVNRFLEGRIALACEGKIKTRYSYNRTGKVVAEEVIVDGTTLVTSKEYDANGKVTAIIYPDGYKVDYQMDDSGAIKEISGLIKNVIYDENGDITEYSQANGVVVKIPRDPVSRRVIEMSAGKGATVLRKVSYEYNGTGNIIATKDESPTWSIITKYTYDGLHRLKCFSDNGLLSNGAYRYDAEGNILEFSETSPLYLSYKDEAHLGRVTHVRNNTEQIAVSYNLNGQITSFGNVSDVRYDAFDRVIQIEKTDGTVINFGYDANNKRIVKQVTGTSNTKNIRYAGGLYEESDDYKIRQVYLGSILAASVKEDKAIPDKNTPVFYLSDYHGTILLASDENGTIIYNQQYSPFGSALNSSEKLNAYLGKEKDTEIDFIQLGARYYIPAIGRFISPDWYVLENPDKPMRLPQGYNVYGYALNNPLSFKDPTGLWFGLDDLIVAAVGFAVGFVSGLVYGLANGQGWDSLLTALETGLTTAAGAWMGWNVGGLIGLAMGGMNGLISGINKTYDWTSVEGWFGFISDSTWSLLGTSLGNIVHVINLFDSSAKYRSDLSQRKNRHVYEGGFGLKEGFAFTQGNVISNLPSDASPALLDIHETLHIWQQRFFGPIFQVTYVAWAVGGAIVGSVAWLFHTDQSYVSFVETAAYYDNPFEYWAYKKQGYWRPKGANPIIAW